MLYQVPEAATLRGIPGSAYWCFNVGDVGTPAMPISLRADYNTGIVRLAAKRTKDGPQARRLLALAAIYEGASRTEAARLGGVTVQIVRD